MAAVLEVVVDRLGDDLGLVAGDAAANELLSNGERVEHQGSLSRGRSGRNRPRRSIESGRLQGKGVATATLDVRTTGNTSFQFGVILMI